MERISVDQLITLADLDEDRLYQLYTEAISKLRSKDTSHQERKEMTIRAMMIKSIISDKYGLKLRHSTPDFDNPLNNERVNRFFK